MLDMLPETGETTLFQTVLLTPAVTAIQIIPELLLELLMTLQQNTSDLEQCFPKCKKPQIILGGTQVWQIKFAIARQLFPFQFSLHSYDDTKDKFSVLNCTPLTRL